MEPNAYSRGRTELSLAGSNLLKLTRLVKLGLSTLTKN